MIIGLIGFTSTLKAQAKKPTKAQVEKRDSLFRAMSKRLELTSEQEVKMKEILRQNQKDLKVIKEQVKNQPKAEKKKALMAQLNTNEQKINAILNPKQQAEFKLIRNEFKEELKTRKKNKPANSKPAYNWDEEELL